MLMFWQIEALPFGDDSGTARAWPGSQYLARSGSAKETVPDATESVGSRSIEPGSVAMGFR
jgi:hypothetical protein